MIDRTIDAEIAERVYGWKPCRVPPDINGEHEGLILTETGKLPRGIELPPKGHIARSYLVPMFTGDLYHALRFANDVRLTFPPGDIPLDARTIAMAALVKWNANQRT